MLNVNTHIRRIEKRRKKKKKKFVAGSMKKLFGIQLLLFLFGAVFAIAIASAIAIAVAVATDVLPHCWSCDFSHDVSSQHLTHTNAN